MIKTSTLLTEYLKHTKDSSDANIAAGKIRINHHYLFLLAEANNYIVERTKYGNSVEDQISYLLPPDYIQMKTVRFKDTAGDWQPVTEIKSLDRWHMLQTNIASAPAPNYYIVINEQGNLHMELMQPPDDDGSQNIEIVYEGYQDDLYFPADYTTGTVSMTQGSSSIVGASSPAWTAAMVGRFIFPTNGKNWYELKTFTDTTHMILVNLFQEASIVSNAYTIAEMTRLPREFNYSPVWGAVWDYYMPINNKKADEYQARYGSELKMIRQKYAQKTKGAVTPGRSVRRTPNLWVPRNYPTGHLSQN